jgi:hypothetical protein
LNIYHHCNNNNNNNNNNNIIIIIIILVNTWINKKFISFWDLTLSQSKLHG